MNTAPKYFVRLQGAVRGPLAVAHLRDLAEGGIVTPATEGAEGADGPWAPLGSLPGGAEVFPPRKLPAFKPVAPPATVPDSAAPLDSHAIVTAARELPAHLAPSMAAAAHASLAAEREKQAANQEIHAMVRDVAEKAARHEPPLTLLKRRMSARSKLYIVLLLAGNALIWSIPLFYDAPYDLWTKTILGSWTLFYTGGLTMMVTMLPDWRQITGKFPE